MSKSVRVNRNLIVDRNIFDFLANTNNTICGVILNANTEEGINYLSTSDKSDMISYLPSDKFKEEYCEDNYINLIRIRYDQIDDIYRILWNNLKS